MPGLDLPRVDFTIQYLYSQNLNFAADTMERLKESILEVRELIDGYVDIDKNEGPNNAMRAQNIIDEVLR